MHQEARRQHQVPEAGLVSPEFRTVLQWDMPAADKIAWLWCWIESRGGLRQFVATAADFGRFEGRSSDSGMRRIKTLTSTGLMRAKAEMIGRRKTGRYLITVLDPREAARTHGVAWDPQPLLFAMEDEAPVPTAPSPSIPLRDSFAVESAAEVPADTRRPLSGRASAPVVLEPGSPSQWPGNAESTSRHASPPGGSRAAEPRAAEPRPSSEAPSARAREGNYLRKPSQREELISPSPPSREGSKVPKEEKSARPPKVFEGGPVPLADVLRDAIPKPPPAGGSPLPPEFEHLVRIEKLVHQMLDLVGDRGLRKQPCVRIAEAMLAGQVSMSFPDAIVADMDRLQKAGELRTKRWMFFVGSAKWRFRKKGLHWPEAER